MKQILKQGKPQTVIEEYTLYILRCHFCGCVFQCTADEFYQSGGMDNTTCPCCSNSISPYTWTQISKEVRKKNRPAKLQELKILYDKV